MMPRFDARMSILGIAIGLVAGWSDSQACSGAEESSSEAPRRTSKAFAWPFLPPEQTEPRGGTTQGSDVVLAQGPHASWQALQDPELTAQERDRRAILALAGSYRVSFQFVETLGLAADYAPPRPYFSWGTEHVHVLEATGDFVSLQHTLVMYFAGEDGTIEGPLVTKHWRQDWKYEDRDLHVYRGDRRWQRETLSADEVRGQWTQAVFQVDDSPRYEALGRWDHSGGLSRWTSGDAWRPLPRREFSARDDYNVLGGVHVITITPQGWVHEQHNRKLVVGDDPAAARCIAAETGFDRYERIVEPDVKTAAEAYFEATGDYWREVRSAWADVLRERDAFRLQSRVDGALLFEEHFGYAAALEEGAAYDAADARRHARSTIAKFLEP
jgi:hypothetical protein